MEAAEDALRAMRKINEDLKKRSHEVLPPPSVAVTMIQGYEKDNVVPGNVRLLTDFQDSAGNEVRRGKRNTVQGAWRKRELKNFPSRRISFMPGGQISSSDPFVKLCLEERNRLFKQCVRPQGVWGFLRAVFFDRMRYAGADMRPRESGTGAHCG